MEQRRYEHETDFTFLLVEIVGIFILFGSIRKGAEREKEEMQTDDMKKVGHYNIFPLPRSTL